MRIRRQNGHKYSSPSVGKVEQQKTEIRAVHRPVTIKIAEHRRLPLKPDVFKPSILLALERIVIRDVENFDYHNKIKIAVTIYVAPAFRRDADSRYCTDLCPNACAQGWPKGKDVSPHICRSACTCPIELGGTRQSNAVLKHPKERPIDAWRPVIKKVNLSSPLTSLAANGIAPILPALPTQFGNRWTSGLNQPPEYDSQVVIASDA